MPIPNKAVGYGNNSTAVNVFRLTYSEALSQPPQWEAYDSSVDFPTLDSITTTNNDIFVGTPGNGHKPMLCLVATTVDRPAGAWKPSSVVSGAALINRLKGQNSFVLDTSTPIAGGSITWNMVLEIPQDLTIFSTMSHILLNRFTYTGDAPVLMWEFNDLFGGDDSIPDWVEMTPGVHGIRHARSGSANNGPYLLTIPPTGAIDAVDGWVTT